MMDVVAHELEEGYNTMHAASESQTSQEKLTSFSEYCLNLVQENAISSEKKKTILFLLKSRLEGSVNLI